MADEDIELEENYNEDKILSKKREFILKYAKNASVEKEWAGDLEIATACTILNININMYTINENRYTIYNKYTTENDISNNNKQTINILYINENHYNLLIPVKENNNLKNNIIQKNEDFKQFKQILLEDKEKKEKSIRNYL